MSTTQTLTFIFITFCFYTSSCNSLKLSLSFYYIFFCFSLCNVLLMYDFNNLKHSDSHFAFFLFFLGISLCSVLSRYDMMEPFKNCWADFSAKGVRGGKIILAKKRKCRALLINRIRNKSSVALENQTIKLWYFDPNALFLKTIEYLSQCLVFLFWYFDLVPRAPSGTFVCPQAHFENWKYLRRGIICHLIVS